MRQIRSITGQIAILLVLLGAVVRTAWLDLVPPGIFRDEAEKAYNAYRLALTAHDANGHLLPLFIQVFGVTTSALYQYAAVPFMWLLGLNEWSARLPAATAGLATILLLFFLLKRERDIFTATFAALLLALSPWHIVFSRWAQQGIFLPLLLTSMMFCWRAWLDAQRSSHKSHFALPGAAALAALAMYTYDIARLFVPLLALGMCVVYRWELWSSKKQLLLSLAVFLVVLSPTVYLMTTQNAAAQARFRYVSILQPGASPFAIIKTFISNYAAHWSPEFLFLTGDRELRHGAGTGVLTWAEGLGLLIGIPILLVRRTKEDLVWVLWLLLFPVSASLTREGIPHALRAIVALPAMQAVAGIGWAALVNRLVPPRQPLARAVFVVAAVAAFLPFAYRYYLPRYRAESAFSWQFGLKDALAILNQQHFARHPVYFHNIVGAQYLVPFYLKTPPSQFRESGFGRYHYLPFRQPGDPPPSLPETPAAIVTVPGPYQWPFPASSIPISIAEDEPPVLLILMNPALVDHVNAEVQTAAP